MGCIIIVPEKKTVKLTFNGNVMKLLEVEISPDYENIFNIDVKSQITVLNGKPFKMEK